MLKRCGFMGVDLVINDKLIVQNSISSGDCVIELIKALCDYLSEEDSLEHRDVTSACLWGHDCSDVTATIVFGNIALSECQVHVFESFIDFDTDKEEWNTPLSFDVDPKSLAIELIEDIERDYDKWLYFDFDDRDSATFEEYEANPNCIAENLSIDIETWLKNRLSEEKLKTAYMIANKRKEKLDYWLNKLKLIVKC